MALQAELRAGGGVCLAETTRPDRPGLGEVLVAMRLAPINPADILSVTGRYSYQPGDGSVAGAEGVGEVVAVGCDVVDFEEGDHVIPLSRGNWSQWRCIPAHRLVKVDAGLPLAQAAMLRINPATAWRLLSTPLLARGDIVVQNGGRSAVARLVTQIAASRGIRVVTLSRQAAPEPPLMADGPDLATSLINHLDGSRPRLALDCVAGDATGRLAACLADGGRITVFGHFSGEACRLPSMILTSRALTVAGFSLRSAEADESILSLRALYAALIPVLKKAPLPVGGIWPLARLDEAIIAAQGAIGRVLLDLRA